MVLFQIPAMGVYFFFMIAYLGNKRGVISPHFSWSRIKPGIALVLALAGLAAFLFPFISVLNNGSTFARAVVAFSSIITIAIPFLSISVAQRRQERDGVPEEIHPYEDF